MIPSDPNSILLLLAGALLVAELIVVTTRFPVAGIWLVAVGSIANSYDLSSLTTLSGVRIAPLDIVAIVLSGSALAEWVRSRQSPRGAALLCLTAVAIARGIAAFGLQPAVNAGREVLYFGAALCFTSAFQKRISLAAFTTVMRAGSSAIMLIAFASIASHGLGSYAEVGSRPVNSQQALVVAETALLLVSSGERSDRRFAQLCLFVVLLSQQRTVWAMTIVAFAVLAVRSDQFSDRSTGRQVRMLVIAASATAAALFIFGPSNLRDSIQETDAVSATSGTLGWRVTSGAQLLNSETQKPVVDRVVGQPAGAGFERFVNGQVWDVTPHNMYLMILISLGAVGLIALLVLYLKAHTRSKTAPGLHAIVCGLMVYSLGYQLGPDQAVLLGLAAAGSMTMAPKLSAVRMQRSYS